MVVKFTYYWNLREDEHGRNLSMMDGFKPGDPLCVAYEGEFEHEDLELSQESTIWGLLEHLFAMFNHDGRRPAEYRGPSMSVGSVVKLFDKTYAVRHIGFAEVDISQSSIAPSFPPRRMRS